MSRSRVRTMPLLVGVLLLVACAASVPLATALPSVAPAITSAAPSATPSISKQRVTFQSDTLTLEGYLFKPAGPGPFPGIIWNHGSEQNPDRGPEFDAIASIFVPAGYAVLAPERRGHGGSQGPYIDDQFAQIKQAQGIEAARKFFVDQMAGPQLDDQLAGLAYFKTQPFVDTNRLAVVGCSYGGIETLFAAERGAGFKAAVAESPGAESWDGNQPLQARLLKAVDAINIPVFLLHPEKDASVAPGYTLGQEFQKDGKPYGLEIYPPYGPADEQGHCFGGAQGFHIWAPDVLNFLSNTVP